MLLQIIREVPPLGGLDVVNCGFLSRFVSFVIIEDSICLIIAFTSYMKLKS